jgi:iron complex outermembrane receptor protein
MKKLILMLNLFWFIQAKAQVNSDSSSNSKVMQELVVKGIQTSKKNPIPFTSITSKQLATMYYGVDVPTLIQRSPSVNAYSDNGTGIGYSFFRLRGMDQTRINTTINGIPVNDPENQGVFFHNFADLLSGTEEIQIQRGVGTSTIGTSSFGGSVAITLKNLSQTPHANLVLGIGSFGSSRISAEVQTGLLGNKWMVYSRIGQVKTNGYRDNSAAQVQSYQFSIGRMGEKSILRFNFFGGNTQNELAYLGIDKATLQSNRKLNPFVNNESDAFKQFFNQIQYSLNISKHASLTTSAYYVRGAAPKFQFLFPSVWGYGFDFFNMSPTSYALNGTDTLFSPGDVMTSYQLDQRLLGAFIQYAYIHKKVEFYAGIHANRFSSMHYMNVLWANSVPTGIFPEHLVYSNTGVKSEQSAFIKLNYKLSQKLAVFGDVQIRNASFKYSSQQMKYRWNDGKVDDMSWTFLNPRLGGRYELNSQHSLNGFIGFSKREPTRFDYFQDDFAPRDIKQNEIKPEQVVDIELSYQIDLKRVQGSVNLFSMNFSNQIIGTGALNNFGYAITGNVAKSVRRGLEIDLKAKLNKSLSVWYNGVFSSNSIQSLNQIFFNTDQNLSQTITFQNTTLLLSPKTMQNVGINGNWLKDLLFADAAFRFVGAQFLDNTENSLGKIPSYHAIDFSFGLNLKKWFPTHAGMIQFRVNNALNNLYSPAGSMSGMNTIDNAGNRGQTPLFMPTATRNYFVTLTFQL